MFLVSFLFLLRLLSIFLLSFRFHLFCLFPFTESLFPFLCSLFLESFPFLVNLRLMSLIPIFHRTKRFSVDITGPLTDDQRLMLWSGISFVLSKIINRIFVVIFF